MRGWAMLSTVALLVAACQAAPSGSSGQRAAADPNAGEQGDEMARCETIPSLSAPETAYGDSPIYVGNEQPTTEVLAWASSQPGFEELWIDRDHLGWIAVGFTEDVDARQADLDRLFPDIGVVAVELEHSFADLADLQQRVSDELGPQFGPSSWISVQQGVVGIGVAFLTDDVVSAIEDRFAGEPVCVEGGDPADAPAPGPQVPAGDGWRLLADELVGQSYRTGIAYDLPSYRQLWTDIGLPGEPPAVDFRAEVVIWFGAVYGSSCPNLRLDDVVVDRERHIVHAEIVLVDPPAACTDDANPRAYVVALQRARLPSGPFAIQLGSEDPPAGVPEERTLVDVDLSQPGAVAEPGDIHGDPSLPKPFVNETGAIIEPGFPAPYRFSVHCGIEWLGIINDIAWRTEVPAGELDFVPPEWQPAVGRGNQSIDVTVLLLTDPEPLIEATANGHTVVYHPSPEDPIPCR